ncbi:hypothetical protein SAMN05216474_0264 [Lishizhenia tianjinensis]|uniref:Uncharacterized protein n=1 Tax=Lishizhenia tianjinensis TaxID=477690 RepID=A0A1I6XJZ7_9FLAO|nr:hypothetical protein SAMN05216474_0264 [Lishizhenia tianjinensis]
MGTPFFLYLNHNNESVEIHIHPLITKQFTPFLILVYS